MIKSSKVVDGCRIFYDECFSCDGEIEVKISFDTFGEAEHEYPDTCPNCGDDLVDAYLAPRKDFHSDI